MIEIIFKVVISAILGIFLVWMWQSHIDVKATFMTLFKNKVEEQAEWISTRQENAIYQNNQLVGKIAGEVKEEDGNFIFDELNDTGALDQSQPFEYKRGKCKITHIQTMSGMKLGNTPGGNFTQKNNVLENVTCEKVSN